MQYTYSQLKSDINGKIKGKIGILIDARSTINQGVRQVLADLDLITTRRKTPLSPNLFNGLFQYTCPTDLKGYSIISVQNQKFTRTPFWSLVPYEQFMRRQDQNTISISDYDGLRTVFIKSDVSDKTTTLSMLESLTSGGGTWGAFGDATNVEATTSDFIQGNASIQFDISSAGGTTAGIVNSTLAQSDLSAFFGGRGNCTVWAYITSTTDLTNYILRIGSDSSNYYTKTVTTQFDGTSFVNGWNLLNFNLATFTTVGTPVETAMDYCALYFTKTAGKISEVGYKFDDIVFRLGEINNLYYYSGYGWQTSGGTYIKNCTVDTDLLNAGEEEYELILTKCSELCADEVDEDKVSEKSQSKYVQLSKIYKSNNPSESLIMISTVADFERV